jgi:hypothetical protein
MTKTEKSTLMTSLVENILNKYVFGRYNIQHNGSQNNDTQHNNKKRDTQHIGVQLNDRALLC